VEQFPALVDQEGVTTGGEVDDVPLPGRGNDPAFPVEEGEDAEGGGREEDGHRCGLLHPNDQIAKVILGIYHLPAGPGGKKTFADRVLACQGHGPDQPTPRLESTEIEFAISAAP
jgi:hypothetical protein